MVRTIIVSMAFIVAEAGVPTPVLATSSTLHTCFGRPPTLIGTTGNDEIEGTPGQDVIVGLGGADLIRGRAGSDLICAEPDGDATDPSSRHREGATVLGGRGSDRIRGAVNDDSLVGGRANDVIYAGAGLRSDTRGDFLLGGRGRDVLFGSDGRDFAKAGPGPDRLYLGPGSDNGTGNRGDDLIFGGPGSDELGGGKLQGIHVDGRNYMSTKTLGEAGDDVFHGEVGADSIALGVGRDRIFGGSGRDNVVVRSSGGRGFLADLAEDRAAGGGVGSELLASVESIFAYGSGDVTLLGDSEGNRMVASSSSERALVSVSGRGGNDSLDISSVGPFSARPSRGRARLGGGSGADRLFAGCGSTVDALYGGADDDRLGGCDGREEVFGGAGDDTFRDTTDEAEDVFDGGEGRDLISYILALHSATVDLGAGVGSTCSLTTCGPATEIAGVEDAQGTYGDDDLTGDGDANNLLGLGGNDDLRGMAGDDRLVGDVGDDRLDGGEGANSNNGGKGTDYCLNPTSSEGAEGCELPS